jgi:hypothetical protein
VNKPLTPAEDFADAVTTLLLSLDKLKEALEVLACELIVAEGRRSPPAS